MVNQIFIKAFLTVNDLDNIAHLIWRFWPFETFFSHYLSYQSFVHIYYSIFRAQISQFYSHNVLFQTEPLWILSERLIHIKFILVIVHIIIYCWLFLFWDRHGLDIIIKACYSDRQERADQYRSEYMKEMRSCKKIIDFD